MTPSNSSIFLPLSFYRLPRRAEALAKKDISAFPSLLSEVATLDALGTLAHFRHFLLTFPVKRPCYCYHDSKIQKKGSDDYAGDRKRAPGNGQGWS